MCANFRPARSLARLKLGSDRPTDRTFGTRPFRPRRARITARSLPDASDAAAAAAGAALIDAAAVVFGAGSM